MTEFCTFFSQQDISFVTKPMIIVAGELGETSLGKAHLPAGFLAAQRGVALDIEASYTKTQHPLVDEVIAEMSKLPDIKVHDHIAPIQKAEPLSVDETKALVAVKAELTAIGKPSAPVQNVLTAINDALESDQRDKAESPDYLRMIYVVGDVATVLRTLMAHPRIEELADLRNMQETSVLVAQRIKPEPDDTVSLKARADAAALVTPRAEGAALRAQNT